MGKCKITKKTMTGKSSQSGTKAFLFRLNEPDATRVALAGGFNDWAPNARQIRQTKNRG